MTDNIKPDHYRKGEIDLYEAFSQIFPHNEYRAGMQMIAMRYMFRDKVDRVEDLGKAIYTLERLKEKEIEHTGENTKTIKDAFDDMAKAFGAFKTKTAGQYLDEIYYKHEDLLERLWKENYRYLARDEDGELFAFSIKPEKQESIWTIYVNGYETFKYGDSEIISNDNFTEIKCEDEEPTEIADLLEKYRNGGESGN